MSTELNEESISEMLGAPTDVSTLGAPGTSIAELAFNLYRETTIFVTFVSHLNDSDEGRLLRNQAIEVGLAVRMSKYMGAVLALMIDKVREHGEVILTLNRCIIESAINLRFFCEKAVVEDYEEFVKSSLRPERDQQRIITANIAARGFELPIETRMLRSISRIFRLSGLGGIEDLEKIPKRKDYKQILTALGWDTAYPMLQGVPSHAVHGTWVDLALHHIEESGTGFRPKPEPIRPDPRLLLPPSRLVLEAIYPYIQTRFADHQGAALLRTRMDDLLERIDKVDSVHEKKMSQPREHT